MKHEEPHEEHMKNTRETHEKPHEHTHPPHTFTHSY